MHWFWLRCGIFLCAFMLKLKAETGTVNASLRRQHCPERQSAEVRAHRCRLRACTPRLTEFSLHHAFIKEKAARTA